MKSKAGRFGAPLAVFVPVFVIGTSMLQRAEDAGAVMNVRCTATFSPDTVAIQQEPVAVGYTVPDSIGTITSVTAAEDSGIRVDSVDAESKMIHMNTSQANEGAWQLTLVESEQRSCTGTLNVKRPPVRLR